MTDLPLALTAPQTALDGAAPPPVPAEPPAAPSADPVALAAAAPADAAAPMPAAPPEAPTDAAAPPDLDALGRSLDAAAEASGLPAAAEGAPRFLQGARPGFRFPTAPGDDLAARILEEKRRAQARGAQDFLETFAEMPAADAPSPEEAPGLARRVAADLGRGLMEAPRQAIGGALDAVRSGLEGIAAFDQWASEAMGLPKLQILNREGQFDPRILSAAEAGKADVLLPDVADPKTATGGLVRGVAQFLTGFAVGAKGLGGLTGGTAAATAGRAAAASAFSDFAAFDGHEARLSDLIQSVPALQNPVTEYLQSDESDGELEGRLKNVAEGALSDVVIGGLVAGLRGIRAARRAKADLGGATYAEAADRLAQRQPLIAGLDRPEMTAARVLDRPLVSRAVDEAGADEAARALTLSRIPAGDGDVYVNWGRINTDDDVKAVIQQMADASKDEIDAARRGVRTNAETALSADQENAWKLLIERRPGAAMNAEQSLALRRLWTASAEKLTEAAQAVERAPTDENVFLFRRAVALHGTIQREVIATRTETARALQQWAIPAGSSDLIARQIGETINTFGGRDVGEDLARRILDMARQGDMAGIDALTRRSATAATLDAVHEYWVNALLSSPATHLRNIISNTAVALTAPIERMTAAAIGGLRGGSDRVMPGEAAAMLQSIGGGLRDALANARRVAATGESAFGPQKFDVTAARAISAEAFRSTRIAPAGGLRGAAFRPLNLALHKALDVPMIAHGIDAIGAAVNLPVKALGVEDDFFKTLNYRMEVHAQAVRQAMGELGPDAAPEALRDRIAALIAEPPDHVSLAARDFAQYNTFTRESGAIVKGISSLRHTLPGLRYIVPFLKTPAQIMRFAAERSPAALALPGVWSDLAAGGARADLALARMGLGTGFLWLAFDAAMNGQITGSGPSNPAERQALQRGGWQPNSVRLGDRYFSFNGLDPMGMHFGIAANLAEMAKADRINTDEDISEAVFAAAGSMGQMLMDRTYFTGMADLFQAMSDPDRYAESYLNRMAASFVPAAIRQIEGAVDPEVRRVTNLVDGLRARIPGLSETVPVMHDLWGREVTNASGLGQAYDAISPIYSRRSDPQPIDRELQRIGYFPAMPAASLTFDGERFSLRNRPEVYERYVVLQGATPASAFAPARTATGKLTARSARLQSYGDASLMETLNAIVEGRHALSAEYADTDDAGREELIRRTISDYREHAKERLREEFPDAFQPGKGVR